MLSDTMLPSRRSAWILFASAITARGQGSGLYQQYCSNQNTGADYQGVNDIYQSNGACFDQCKGEYAFAIVQWQNCWCSNYIPESQDDTNGCDQQCPGYPGEMCGNEDNALYGYIPLNNAPSGTMGASSLSQRPTSNTYKPPPAAPTTSAAPPEPTTQISTETSVETSIVTSEVEPEPETSITPTPSSSSIAEPTSSSAPSSTTSETSHSASPVTSVQVITVSGARVTQTVTSTPFVNNGSKESQQQMSRSGLSGGAIAGIVIGALIGLAAMLLAAFLLWRRKQRQDAEAGGATGSRPPKRTTSVLSKTGLLSRGARPVSMAENHTDEGYSSVRHSMLFGGAGAAAEGVTPSSPLGGSQDNASSTRRHSKPMVYDQRLNPSALFANAEANGSRVSMQDTQDYSRPLGIANPDLRASIDSRYTGR